MSRLCEFSLTTSGWRKTELFIFRVIEHTVPISLSISETARESAADEEIMDAMTCLWNTGTSNSFYPFRFELLMLEKILLRGTRLIITKGLQKIVLELAHEGHPGESAMKRRLRVKVSRRHIDENAENFVKTCKDCMLVSQPPGLAPTQRTVFPTN